MRREIRSGIALLQKTVDEIKFLVSANEENEQQSLPVLRASTMREPTENLRNISVFHFQQNHFVIRDASTCLYIKQNVYICLFYSEACKNCT